MGERKRKLQAMMDAGAPCIFCCGARPATTEEHCPPRALFRDRRWPEGYAFPACERCNGGTSFDDLLVAFMAHLNPVGEPERLERGKELLSKIRSRDPKVLHEMFGTMTASEQSAAARELGDDELALVKVPERLHRATSTLAGKLTKGVYFKQTGRIFPAGGAIMFHWFTNADAIKPGGVPALNALASIAAMSTPKAREGEDLKDQFDYKYSSGEDGKLHLLQVVFGRTFGFVSIFSPEPGFLEAMRDRMEARVGRAPFEFLRVEW